MGKCHGYFEWSKTAAFGNKLQFLCTANVLVMFDERFMSQPMLLQVMDECNHCVHLQFQLLQVMDVCNYCVCVQFQQGRAGDSRGDEQHCADRCFSL